ncbi:hypothetical protein UFOVP239_28 [uncultured Caudovirales phage]|uniref:Uncharacterized protein n=1 Tax=uncultured Caudovirales phage TaxID=2100421 RepID=A0A6J7WQ21_9CAUD|nr:hypothetical protein UFOVP239_28 [uncultured Caudovirales phage]
MSKIDINYFLSATATWKESMMQNYAKQFGTWENNPTAAANTSNTKTLREAAQLALDALHLWHWTKQTAFLDPAHDALRDALLGPDHIEDHLEMVPPFEQEPTGKHSLQVQPIVWALNPEDLEEFATHEALAKPVILCGRNSKARDRLPLYTSPPKPQSNQKPVAWMLIDASGEEDDITYEDPMGDLPEGWTCKPLYTSPPQRPPLTNGEIYTAYITATNQTLRPQDERLAFAFARAIEREHGIGGEE